VFTARYALSPYIKHIRFVFKGLNRTLAKRITEIQGGLQAISSNKQNRCNAVPAHAMTVYRISEIHKEVLLQIRIF
jgi:hypothetical protein